MKLRYVELPPERIFNRLGIENLTAWNKLGTKYGSRWWDPDVVELRQKFAEYWIADFNKSTQHFKLLKQSIQESGIKCPVSAVSGPPRDKVLKANSRVRPAYFPPESEISLKDVVYTQPFGGSRVTIAQELGLAVPCAVHDFSNLFPNAPEITGKNYMKWFGKDYMFTRGLPHLRVRRHSHIKNSKYNAMNQHTRQAQRRASNVALGKLGV